MTEEHLQRLIKLAEKNTTDLRNVLLERDGTCSDQYSLDLEFIYSLPEYEEDE